MKKDYDKLILCAFHEYTEDELKSELEVLKKRCKDAEGYFIAHEYDEVKMGSEALNLWEHYFAKYNRMLECMDYVEKLLEVKNND